MVFNMWLDVFLIEKAIDLEETFEVEGPSGTNFMDYALIVEFIKAGDMAQQTRMKNKLVQIDFNNGDVKDFFRFIAQALAQ